MRNWQRHNQPPQTRVKRSAPSRRPQCTNKQMRTKAQQNKTETTQMNHKRSTVPERSEKISHWKAQTKQKLICNKRSTISTHLDGDAHLSTSYGVCTSQLIRFARASSYVTHFNTWNKLLTLKLLKQGYRYHKLRKTFSKSYRRYYDLISKFQVGINLSCTKNFRNLNSMVTWCINWRRLLALIIFQRSSLK